MKFGKYIENNLEAWSQALNAFLFGNPNDTFSARVGNIKYGNREGLFPFPLFVWMIFVWLFDRLWAGHLEKAIGPD